MAKKSKQPQVIEQGLERVEETLSKSEQFIEKNYKKIFYGIIGILTLIVIYFAYQKYVKNPREKEAQESIFIAQRYFELNDFTKALDGDGNNEGFKNIIENYGSTKTRNLAKFYAGICCRELKRYDDAIAYLKDFSSDDFYLSGLKFSAIADCYYLQGNFTDAAKYYEKAANINPNNYATPTYLLRAGFAYEKMGFYDKSLNLFKEIEKKYANSFEGRDIQKYITYIKMKMEK